jgi:hypothetical protein
LYDWSGACWLRLDEKRRIRMEQFVSGTHIQPVLTQPLGHSPADTRRFHYRREQNTHTQHTITHSLNTLARPLTLAHPPTLAHGHSRSLTVTHGHSLTRHTHPDTYTHVTSRRLTSPHFASPCAASSPSRITQPSIASQRTTPLTLRRSASCARRARSQCCSSG